MPTTDGNLARDLALLLSAWDPTATVLHGYSALSSGEVRSDVDLAVGKHPLDLLTRLLSELQGSGLSVLQIARVDYGQWVAFVSDIAGSSAAHLDLLCDPQGRGKLGLRTDRLISSGSVGTELGIRRTSDHAEALFVLAKRREKQQLTSAQAILDDRIVPDSRLAITLARGWFSPFVARQLAADITNRRATCSTRSLPHRLRTGWRYVARLRSPVSPPLYILTDESDSHLELQKVIEVFDRFLVGACVVHPAHHHAHRPAVAFRRALLRRRPGLVVIEGRPPRYAGRPPIRLSTSETLVPRLVEELATYTQSSLMRRGSRGAAPTTDRG